jgi:Domain of unknown function (DUF4157)
VGWSDDVISRDLDDEREQRTGKAHVAEPPAQEFAPPPSPPPLARLASQVGNHAMSQVIGRMQGDGILEGGGVHPGVEAAISSSRGSGASLDEGVRSSIAPQLGDSLSDVKVHTDSTADALARSVSARAFATGSDVFFARGEYQPGTADGNKLLAHELTHVVQQRGAPTSGPMTVSNPDDAMETEADAVASQLA